MAENERFVIQKIQTNKKCFFREQDGIESHPRTRCLVDPQSYDYVFDSDCQKCREGKTREEYEDMIARTMFSHKYPSKNELTTNWLDYKEKYKKLRLGTPVEIRIAEQICNTLFGKSK